MSYAVGWAIGVPVPADSQHPASFLHGPRAKRDLHLAVARMLLWALTMGRRDDAVTRGRRKGTLFVRARRIRKKCSRGC